MSTRAASRLRVPTPAERVEARATIDWLVANTLQMTPARAAKFLPLLRWLNKATFGHALPEFRVLLAYNEFPQPSAGELGRYL